MDTTPPEELRLHEIKIRTRFYRGYRTPLLRRRRFVHQGRVRSGARIRRLDMSVYVERPGEAGRAGQLTNRGIKYCFELEDEAGMEQIGVNVCASRFLTLARTRTRS